MAMQGLHWWPYKCRITVDNRFLSFREFKCTAVKNRWAQFVILRISPVTDPDDLIKSLCLVNTVMLFHNLLEF